MMLSEAKQLSLFKRFKHPLYINSHTNLTTWNDSSPQVRPDDRGCPCPVHRPAQGKVPCPCPVQQMTGGRRGGQGTCPCPVHCPAENRGQGTYPYPATTQQETGGQGTCRCSVPRPDDRAAGDACRAAPTQKSARAAAGRAGRRTGPWSARWPACTWTR